MPVYMAVKAWSKSFFDCQNIASEGEAVGFFSKKSFQEGAKSREHPNARNIIFFIIDSF